MKTIVLAHVGQEEFDSMKEAVKYKRVIFIDTAHCDETSEYNHLLDGAECLTQSDNDILLAKFSGRTSIISNLGDVREEMVIAVSSNKQNPFYVEFPTKSFITLLSYFEKGES
jgi:hypothetical protein